MALNELTVTKINLGKFYISKIDFIFTHINLFTSVYFRPDFNLKENVKKLILSISFKKLKIIYFRNVFRKIFASMLVKHNFLYCQIDDFGNINKNITFANRCVTQTA